MLFLFVLFQCALQLQAQKVLTPQNLKIDQRNFNFKETKYTVYEVKDKNWKPVASYTASLHQNEHQFILTKTYLDTKGQWYKTNISTAAASTFSPISAKSKSPKYEYNIVFGTPTTVQIKTLNTSEKDNIVQLPLKGAYFDFSMLEPTLSSLPLKVGYKATIPLFYYDEKSGNHITDYSITEVKSYEYWSTKTGKHASWLVSVLEHSTNATYYYIIDKKDHRLWQREMPMGNNTWEICVNEELDYQPIVNTFNKKEALDKVHNGNSSIIGVAFARDHSKGGMVPTLVNINKAQYAPKGTVISIILNSPYLDEWKTVNKKIRKKHKIPEVPIDSNVASCIKTTKVYDDKGHFEFTNLAPGEYVLMTSFDYTHNYVYSYYAGTSYLMHPSGTVLSSQAVYNTASASTGANASIEKKVTIKEDGETVSVKLKDTK
ncbi:hypothetical protein ACG2LH_18090 [Zhouia sp. PK063]|uniref:DUF3108 domain-containing protein n=1 Tax=Zhouia sp. PK063 TaxID=3373602 RepID=UPI00378CC66E